MRRQLVLSAMKSVFPSPKASKALEAFKDFRTLGVTKKAIPMRDHHYIEERRGINSNRELKIVIVPFGVQNAISESV